MTTGPLVLATPSSSQASISFPLSKSYVSPLAVASILDHHVRRLPDQDRVFGTLLGTWQDNNTVIIESAFGVPYEIKKAKDGFANFEIMLDTDYHSSMLDMMLKVNPKEVVVGWYASSPLLNSFTPLIHSFYTTETSRSSHAAVHLVVNPESLSFQTYSSVPLGLGQKPDNSTFKLIPSEIRVDSREKAGIELLSNPSQLPASAALISQNPLNAQDNVRQVLLRLSYLISETLKYVRDVNDNQVEGDEKIGKLLWSIIGAAGDIQAGREGKINWEEMWNNHLADLLMISYLSNIAVLEADIAARLNLFRG